MKIIAESVYLIVSKCNKLIAKGNPGDRYICHVDENETKKILTYSTEGRAKSGFTNSSFYLSGDAEHYIIENYPQFVRYPDYAKGLPIVKWQDIAHLFEAKEFRISYDMKAPY